MLTTAPVGQRREPAGMRGYAERRPWTIGLGLGALHAVCFGLAFAPVGWWPLGLLSLAPMMLLAWWACDARKAMLSAWVTVFPAWFVHQRWLVDVTAPGWPMLAAYLSLYPAACVWLGVRLRRSAWAGRWWWWWWALMAVIWTGLETLRAEVVFHGYAWYLVGQLWPVEWAGRALAGAPASVLTLATAAASAVLVSGGVGLWRGQIRVWLLWSCVVAASVAGVWRASRVGVGVAAGSGERLVVGVVQSNVPQSNKTGWTFERRREDFERMKALTREAAAGGAELIVWPETMFPGLALNAEAMEAERSARLVHRGGEPSTLFHDELLALQREVGTPLIVGAIAAEGVRFEGLPGGGVEWKAERKFNSVFVVQDGEVDGRRYDKMHLTPFGETMPYISWSKWLERQLLAIGAGGMKFDLTAGVGQKPVEVRMTKGSLAGERLAVATPVCFEMTNAGLVRGLVRGGGARLIVTLTNDGWFGPYGGGREEHLRAGVWRAWELGAPVVRAANTGVSCVIGSDGAVVARLEPWTEGVLLASVEVPAASRERGAGADAVNWAVMGIVVASGVVASIGVGRRKCVGGDSGG